MTRHALAVGAFAASLLAASAGVASAQAPCFPISDVAFHQLDWLRADGTTALADSAWGQMTFGYAAAPMTGYLNVTASDPAFGTEAWVVRNLPLFAALACDTTPRREVVYFDLQQLGLAPGVDDWTQVDYRARVDCDLRSTPPTDPVTSAPVAPLARLALDSPDEAPVPGVLVPPAAPAAVDVATAPTNAGARDIRGVQEDTAHCFAGSTARSLDWLNRRYNLRIAPAAGMQGICDGRADKGKTCPTSAGGQSDCPGSFCAKTGQQFYADLKAADVSKPNGDGSSARDEWIARKNTLARTASNDRIRTKVWDGGNQVDAVPDVTEESGDFATWLKREFATEDVELAYSFTGGSHIVTIVDVYTQNDELYVKYRDDEAQNTASGDADETVKNAKIYLKNDIYRFGSDDNEVFFGVSESYVSQPIRRDPASIQFGTGQWATSGHDRLRLHATVEPLGTIDPAVEPFSLFLSNLCGPIYDAALPAGSLVPRGSSGTRFAFVDANARSLRSGIAKVRMRYLARRNVWRVDVVTYGDLVAATIPTMLLQIRLGAEEFSTEADWEQKSNGWRLPLTEN